MYEFVLVVALRLLKLPSVPSNAPEVLRTSTKTKSKAVDRDSLVVMLSQNVRFAGWPAGMLTVWYSAPLALFEAPRML